MNDSFTKETQLTTDLTSKPARMWNACDCDFFQLTWRTTFSRQLQPADRFEECTRHAEGDLGKKAIGGTTTGQAPGLPQDLHSLGLQKGQTHDRVLLQTFGRRFFASSVL